MLHCDSVFLGLLMAFSVFHWCPSEMLCQNETPIELSPSCFMMSILKHMQVIKFTLLEWLAKKIEQASLIAAFWNHSE